MKKAQILIVAMVLLISTQSFAFDMDFTNYSGHSYYDLTSLSFNGSANIVQSLDKGAAGIIDVGDTFTISKINMLAGLAHYTDSTLDNYLDSVDLGKLKIVGTLTGHVVNSALHYVYDTIDLTLKYGNNTLAALKYNNTTGLTTGGNLTDGVLGTSSSSSYNIVAPMTTLTSGWLEFNGVAAELFNKVIAITTGHISFQDSAFSPTLTQVSITNAKIDGELLLATPEPASMLLLGSGLLGLYGVRRRRKSN